MEVVAPWVVAASQPYADWYFGSPDVADEILREWMQRPSSEVYLGRAILAEDDAGTPRGCIIALSGSELARCRAADFASFSAELGHGPEVDEVVTELLTASHEAFPPVGDDDLYVSRVGVDAGWRGRGLGRALVISAMEAFADRGLRAVRLDVSADNHGAIRAYEAAGLTITARSHSPTAGVTYCAMEAPLRR